MKNAFILIVPLIIITLLLGANNTNLITTEESFIIIENKQINEFKNVIFFSSINNSNYNFIKLLSCNKIDVKVSDSILCIAYFINNKKQSNYNYQIMYELFDDNNDFIGTFNDWNKVFTNDSQGIIKSTGIVPLTDYKTIGLRGNAGDNEWLNALSINIEIKNETNNGLFILINKNEYYKGVQENNYEINNYLKPYAYGSKAIIDDEDAFCIITQNENICVNIDTYQNFIAWFYGIKEESKEVVIFLLIFLIILSFNSTKLLKKLKKLPIFSAIIIGVISFVLLFVDKRLSNSLFIIIFYIMFSQIIISFYKKGNRKLR